MKVFTSLNCILCNEPFARVANQPRSPHDLQCGLAMCHECFENEKLLKEEQRKHQCGNDNCFSNANYAYFLIAVLKQETELTLSPMGDGYLLVKPIVVPECSICLEAYSNEIKEKKSFVLRCNHIICTECYQKLRQPNQDNATRKTHKYRIRCPICKGLSLMNADKRKDRFHDFLDELPRMNQQLEARTNADSCDDCHNKTYNGLFPKSHMEVLDDIDAFGTLLSQEEILKEAFSFVILREKNYLLTKLKTDFDAAAKKCLPNLLKFGTEIKLSLPSVPQNRLGLSQEDSEVELRTPAQMRLEERLRKRRQIDEFLLQQISKRSKGGLVF